MDLGWRGSPRFLEATDSNSSLARCIRQCPLASEAQQGLKLELTERRRKRIMHRLACMSKLRKPLS